MQYAIGKPGEPVRLFFESSSAGEIEAQLLSDEVAVETTEGRTGGLIVDGTVFYPPPSLDDLRRRKWTEAKNIRGMRMSAPCSTPLGIVDADPTSLQKINGAVTAAMVAQIAAQPFTIDWTLHDNSVVTLDATEMIAMGMAVMAYVAACQNAGTTIRTAIYTAEDEAALAAIDVTMGYPLA